jgi:crotonobetainyl-CoA:carnitine CoA-transferase CaiB-like acyl-CoA transferase
VLDFTNNIAGPMATAMMADFGAEVIKVEKPNGGDDSRHWAAQIKGVSTYYYWHNRGKKSIVLDLKNTEDLILAKNLLLSVDVVVESFRPGIMARLGLSYEEIVTLNPNVVMCSISAFGQNGPYRDLPGYDLVAQAMSGVMDITGNADGPPMKLGPAIADYATAFNAFGAISAALFYRERSGNGQHIDVSLLECLMAANDYCEPAFTGHKAERSGNHHAMLAPYGIFNGKEGSLLIAVLNPKLWSHFTCLIGKPELAEDPRFITAKDRVDNIAEVTAIIEDWLKGYSSVHDAEQLLINNGIPCAKVRTVKELLTDPHLLQRGMVTDLEIPGDNQPPIKARGVHINFSRTPGKLGKPPDLGEHQEEVLKNLSVKKK